MKKILSITLALALMFTLAACENGTDKLPEQNKENEGQTESSHQSDKGYPKIEEINIAYTNSVVYDEPAVLVGYTNNSKYTILLLDLEYRLIENVTQEQLVVFEAIQKSANISDEDLFKISPYVRDWMVCDPGETVDGAHFYIKGNYTATDTKQCDLIEIVSARIDYIGNDGKRHTVNYYAENNGYSVSTANETLFNWSDGEYAKTIPQPETRVLEIDYDEEDYFQFTAYDIEFDQYREYIEMCKEAGFNNDNEDNTYSFWGTDNNGLTINVRFFSYMNAIELTAEHK